jgi:hypothetical protein
MKAGNKASVPDSNFLELKQKLKTFSTENTSVQFKIFLSSTLNQKYL